MAELAILFARSARKELEALDQPLAGRILRRIEGLATEPRPRGARKLRGSTALWRLRVGDHRVIYAVDEKKHSVDIIAIRHRSDAYR